MWASSAGAWQSCLGAGVLRVSPKSRELLMLLSCVFLPRPLYYRKCNPNYAAHFYVFPQVTNILFIAFWGDFSLSSDCIISFFYCFCTPAFRFIRDDHFAYNICPTFLLFFLLPSSADSLSAFMSPTFIIFGIFEQAYLNPDSWLKGICLSLSHRPILLHLPPYSFLPPHPLSTAISCAWF